MAARWHALLIVTLAGPLTGVGLAQDEQAREEPGSTWGKPNLDLELLDGWGVGLEFDWDIWEGEVYDDFLGLDFGLMGAVETEGKLPLYEDDDLREPSYLSLRGDLFATFDYGSVDGDYQQWVNVGLTPFEVESNKDFDEVHYKVAPFVQFSVPYSTDLAGALHELLGIDDGRSRPATLRLEHAFVSEIEDRERGGAEDRFGLDAKYRLDLWGDLQLATRYRYFDEEHVGDFDYGEVRLSYDISDLDLDLGKSELFLQYAAGELPTSIEEADTVSVGFSWGMN